MLTLAPTGVRQVGVDAHARTCIGTCRGRVLVEAVCRGGAALAA